MIAWPRRKLPPLVERNLERFRTSGAARELEDRPHTYEIESFAWTEDHPLRFVLRDEAGCRVTIVLDADGEWREEPMIEAPIVRNERTLPHAA